MIDSEIKKAVKSHEEKLLANGLKCLEPFEVRDIVERQRKDKEDAFLLAADIVNADKIVKAEAYKEFEKLLMSYYAEFDEVNEIITLSNLEKAVKDCLKELVGDTDA